MNKSIIAIVIVAVVLVGGYFLFKATSQSTPSAPQTSNRQIVPPSSTQQPTSQRSPEQVPVTEKNIATYNESGFSPSVLRVKIGTTVSFKNEESEPMWVASNPHPIHTDYSGFDAKRRYSKGESYSFIFTKSGNWKYHNHLNPGEGGTIVVE